MKLIGSTFVAFVALGCVPTDEPSFILVPRSAETGEGESESGDTGEGPNPPNCADPEFEAKIPQDPTISECVGQGGGALVFDVFSGFGKVVIPDKSKASPTVFFSDDPNGMAVGACCGAAALPDEVASACASDCARAACNTAMAALEDAVADPSSLQGNGCGKHCAMNVAMSMEEWILPQLQTRAGYDSCLLMANLNSDPNVDYTAAEFLDEQLTFQMPQGACTDFGCLSNVRLRVYCAVESVIATDEVCAMASNAENSAVPESDRFIVASSPTEVTSGPN